MNHRLRIVLAALSVLLVVTACGTDPDLPAADEDEAGLRVAVLFPGRVDDQAFNEEGLRGLQAAEANHNLETAYAEDVPEAQYESTMREFANQDFDVVIGNGFQFQDAAEAIAPDFPDIYFVVVAGQVSNAPNLASVSFEEWEAGYLAGVVAGLVTESDQVAYMGGIPIPPIAMFGNAYQEGAQRSNPDIEVNITYTGSFDDVAKGKATAAALIDQGADIVTPNANVEGPAAIETAQERGVRAIGALLDSAGIAEDTVVGSAIVRFGDGIDKIVRLILDDEFEPTVYAFGASDGVIDFVWNPEFEGQFPEAAQAISDALEDLVNGEIEPPSTEP